MAYTLFSSLYLNRVNLIESDRHLSLLIVIFSYTFGYIKGTQADRFYCRRYIGIRAAHQQRAAL